MEEGKAGEAAKSKEGGGEKGKTAASGDNTGRGRSPSPAPSIKNFPAAAGGRRNRNRIREFRNRNRTREPLPEHLQANSEELYPPGLPKHLQAEFEKLYPSGLPKKVLYDMVSPVEQGSDWTLDTVGIDLVPDIDNSKYQPVAPASLRPSLFGPPVGNPTPVCAHKPSESAKTTFRASYRRTIMTCVVQEGNLMHVNSRYVNHDVTWVDDIASGDYTDLQGEYVQTGVKHEGGKVDDEREDDLEIVVQQDADGAEDEGK